MPNFFALNQALQTTAPALFKLVENSQENKILQQGKQKVFEMEQQIDKAIETATDEDKKSLMQYKYSFQMSPEVNAFKNFEKGNFEQFGKKLKMFQLLPDYKTIMDKTKGADFKYTSIGDPLLGKHIPLFQQPKDYDASQMYQKVMLNTGETTWQRVGYNASGGVTPVETIKNNAWNRAMDSFNADLKTLADAGIDPNLTTALVSAPDSKSRQSAVINIINAVDANKKLGAEAAASIKAKLYKEWRANLVGYPELQSEVDGIIDEVSKIKSYK